MAAITKFAPDLLLNAGTAGGFKYQGGAIGDVYLCSGVAYHDRHIPIPGFVEYGFYKRPTHATPNLLASAGFKSGVISTGNSLETMPKDMEFLKSNDACVKDMEAAGLAEMASHYKTPFVAIKAVTDIVDGDKPTQDEFLANLASAATAIRTAVLTTFDFMEGKTVADL
jgi:5'-methylthioadenosine nucleosidase